MNRRWKVLLAFLGATALVLGVYTTYNILASAQSFPRALTTSVVDVKLFGWVLWISIWIGIYRWPNVSERVPFLRPKLNG